MSQSRVIVRADVPGHGLLEREVVVTVRDAAPEPTILGSAGTAIHDVPRFGLAAHDYAGWRDPIDHAAAFQNIKMHLRGSDINQPGLWVPIANGDEDAQIRSYAAQMRAGPGQLVTFGHEPRFTQGTQAEYRAAWSRILAILRAEGIGASKVGTVPLASQYRDGSAPGWIPLEPLDFYGVDGYGDSSRPTAQATFAPVVALHGAKPKAIFETSMRNGTDAQQVAYVQSLDAMLKADPTWIGCCTWEGNQSGFDTTLRAPALTVLEGMAVDAFYGRAA